MWVRTLRESGSSFSEGFLGRVSWKGVTLHALSVPSSPIHQCQRIYRQIALETPILLVLQGVRGQRQVIVLTYHPSL